MPDHHVNLFGITFDRVRMSGAVERILAWCSGPSQPNSEPCRYVVTPNVDHAVLFQEREPLRTAYAGAALVLVDGAPIVWASRLLRQSLPERVAGSDLVPALFTEASRACRKTTRRADFQSAPHAGTNSQTAQHGTTDHPSAPQPPSLKVFLLGAAPGVAERAARRIAATWPGVSVVGTYSPPLGFENDPAENERILELIADAAPDVVLVGLGAPKQELWTHKHRARIAAKVVLCVGATIDFLAGEKRRSPQWMRRVGLEWLHRACSEPRRLARRYAKDACIFPKLVWQEWRTARRASCQLACPK